MRIAVTVLVGQLVGISAWAQPPVNSFEELQNVVRQGQETIVTEQSPVAPSAGAQQSSSLSSLSSLLQPGDVIHVLKADQHEVRGKFVGVSDEALTLMVDGHPFAVAASDIRAVRRRGGGMVKQGALFGCIAGATAGAISGSDSGEKLAIGTVACGGFALWGAIIGTFMHDYPVVYQKPESTVHWLPVLAPHRIGVVAQIHF